MHSADAFTFNTVTHKTLKGVEQARTQLPVLESHGSTYLGLNRYSKHSTSLTESYYPFPFLVS